MSYDMVTGNLEVISALLAHSLWSPRLITHYTRPSHVEKEIMKGVSDETRSEVRDNNIFHEVGARRRKKPTGYQEKRFLHNIILHNFCKSGVPACESEGNDKSLSGGVIPIGAAKRRRPRDSSSLILAHPSSSGPV